MSNMQFQSDSENEFGRPPVASGFDMSGLLIKWGVASSRQQAEYILITVGVICLIIAGYFFFYSGGSDAPIGPVYANPDAPVVIVE